MRVTESLSPAWEHMKRVLFRPFNLGTWFSFGFIFFLQSCAEGGGSSFNFPGGGGNGGSRSSGYGSSGSHDTDNSIFHALDRVTSALHHGDVAPRGLGDAEVGLIVGIAIAAIVIAIPIALLVMWLGARGQMMAIRAVASGAAPIGETWRATSGAGSKFFKFHLAILGITLGLLLPFAGAGGAVAMSADRAHPENLIVPIVLIGLVAVLAMIPLMVVSGLGRNFVAPIMLKHGVGAREGWKMFWARARGNVGPLFVFFLLKGVFGMLAAVVATMAGLITCCVGFLPVVHQTIMAPYHVFERAWSLQILASLDPDFDMIAQAPAAGPGFGPPGLGGPPGFGPGGGYGPSGYGPGGGGYGGPPMPPGGFGAR